MIKKSKQAFTLVELIVVITILAILWTIAFIAMNWYSKTARDSARISDMAKIRSSLELFFINSNKYPAPTEAYPVTYSWWLAWYQWIFWNSTFMNVDKLDKIPTDPLTWKEYAYSVLNTWQEFEIASISEWDDVALNNNFNKVSAAEKTAWANITWTYNGVSLKVNANSTSYILAVPSIITSIDLVWVEANKDLVTIMTQKELVIDWYQNLPNNYIWTSYDSNKETINPDFTLVNDLLVYEWDVNNLTSTQFIWYLQDSYTWTLIASLVPTHELFTIDLLGWTTPETIEAFWTSFINNNLWWSVETRIFNTCWWIAHNTTKTFYSTGSVDFPTLCSSVEQDFVCLDWTWTDSVNSQVIWDYTYDTCTSIASNCSANETFAWTTSHTYNVPVLNHIEVQSINSNNVIENNWTFYYTSNITCTDWTLSNDAETWPTLVSCDTNYTPNWDVCEPDVCEFGTSEFWSCLFGS